MVEVEKVRGTSTYVLKVDGKVIDKGDKKRMVRKANRLLHEPQRDAGKGHPDKG